MATDEEVQRLRKKTYEKICTLFDLLDREGLLIKNSRVIENSFLRVFMRVESQRDILANEMKLLEDKEKFSKFLEANKQFGITEKSFMFDLTCQMAQFLLSEYEMIKRFLREILNLPKLNIRKKNKAMYGGIINQIGNYKDESNQLVFDLEGLKTIFYVDIRNVLGHDSWWVDNGNFVVEKDGKPDPYTFADFSGVLVATSMLMEAISVKYLQKFFPKSLDELKSEFPSLFQDNNQQSSEQQS